MRRQEVAMRAVGFGLVFLALLALLMDSPLDVRVCSVFVLVGGFLLVVGSFSYDA